MLFHQANIYIKDIANLISLLEESEDWPNPSLDPETCYRILVIYVVSAIEAMIADLKDFVPGIAPLLDDYFGKSKDLDRRIQTLREIFRQVSINFDESVILDFKAVKYLRNAIVHGGLRPEATRYVKTRCFSTNLMKIDKQSIDKTVEVYYSFLLYLTLLDSGHSKASSNKSPILVKDVGEDAGIEGHPKHLYLVFIRGRIRRLIEVLRQCLEETGINEDYASVCPSFSRVWSNDIKLSSSESYKNHAREAYALWRNQYRFIEEGYGITIQLLKKGANIFSQLFDQGARFKVHTTPLRPMENESEIAQRGIEIKRRSIFSLTDKGLKSEPQEYAGIYVPQLGQISQADACQLANRLCEGYGAILPQDICLAFSLASPISMFYMNESFFLFAILCPIVDRKMALNYLKEADTALDMAKVWCYSKVLWGKQAEDIDLGKLEAWKLLLTEISNLVCNAF